MLEIKNLQVHIENKHILKNFALHVEKGSIHAIMGPNGAGKSTLAKALSGHPHYEVEGEVYLKGENLIDMEPDGRSHHGLFLGFQYPIEVPGVNTLQFLYEAYKAHKNTREEKPLSEEQFTLILAKKRALLRMDEQLLSRGLNEGFSGGEKKKFEILQMLLLEPDLVILDETDSGLDIDAMKIVAEGVNQYRNKSNAVILITHYQRLLDYIQPDFVHVMKEGRIVQTGPFSLAKELEKKGYEQICQETSV